MLKIIKYFGTIKHFKLPDLGESNQFYHQKKSRKQQLLNGMQKKVMQYKKQYIMKLQFDPVADVSTDKMFTQIPSSFSGIVHKRYHKENDQCQVGDMFLDIEIEEGVGPLAKETIQKPTQNEQVQEVKQTKSQQTHKPQSNSSIQRVSPSAKYLAQLNNININDVKGTGIYGTITKEDVSNHNAQPVTQMTSNQQSQIIKMTDFQKGMQKSMTLSNKIPHLYLQEEIDITSLTQLREQIKKQQNITFMTLFIKSFSQALLQYPILNSTYDVDQPFQYTTHTDHNVSIAMDTVKGLVVPNIKKVQNLSILEVQAELNKLKKLGEESRLGPNELGGGTICISNIGSIAGTYLGPLILSPQVCIVGIGRVIVQPRFIGGSYKPRRFINTSFGCDHRLIDGATVARFQSVWKNYLEQPELLILNQK